MIHGKLCYRESHKAQIKHNSIFKKNRYSKLSSIIYKTKYKHEIFKNLNYQFLINLANSVFSFVVNLKSIKTETISKMAHNLFFDVNF
jgi:hypothetical protein